MGSSMERVPGDVLRLILCRLRFKEVLMIRDMFPKLVAEANLKEIAEMGRIVYSDTQIPAFLALLEYQQDMPRENSYRLLVSNVHSQIEQAKLPLLKGEMKVIATGKGLALITVRNYNPKRMGRGLSRTFVLNVSSGGSIEIRRPPKHCKTRKTSRKDHCSMCGSSYSVGYDIATKLFTIFRLTTSLHTPKDQSFFDIYSSETRRWKGVVSEFDIETFLRHPPVYSNGRFFFVYKKSVDPDYNTAKLGVITGGHFSFDSSPLPYLDGKCDLCEWTLYGWEGGIILKSIRMHMTRRIYWRFKEELLDVSSTSCDYQSCCQDCRDVGNSSRKT